MNQLQVLKKLIPIYKKAINRIADGENVEYVLRITHTICGICNCARFNGVHIYSESWVQELSNWNWYDEPSTINPSNAIECLSYRLTIMQLMVMELKQTT